MRRVVAVGLCTALAAIGAWAWSLRQTGVPPDLVQPGDGGASNALVVAEREVARWAPDRLPVEPGAERNAAPPAHAPMQESRVLTPAERDVVQEHIRASLANDRLELERLRQVTVTSTDPWHLLREADLLRSIELWAAVERGVAAGDYTVVDGFPERLPKPTRAEVHHAQPYVFEGVARSVVVRITPATSQPFFDAWRYHDDQKTFLHAESARRFNARPHAEREALFQQFESSRRRAEPLPAALQQVFPPGCHVDPRSLLMQDPTSTPR
jgi:hypothetical protein